MSNISEKQIIDQLILIGQNTTNNNIEFSNLLNMFDQYEDEHLETYKNLGEEGRKSLFRALKDPKCKITSLIIEPQYHDDDDEGINTSELQILAEALKTDTCQIKVLKLISSNIESIALEPLTEALCHPNCKVEELDLFENYIGDAGIRLLTQALCNENCKLKALHIGGNLSDYEDIPGAIVNPQCGLESLSLLNSNGDCDSRVVRELLDSITNPSCNLKSLKIDIEFEMYPYLFKALIDPNCSLRSLLIHLNEQGFKDLIPFISNPEFCLEELKLPGYELHSLGDDTQKSLLQALNKNEKIRLLEFDNETLTNSRELVDKLIERNKRLATPENKKERQEILSIVMDKMFSNTSKSGASELIADAVEGFLPDKRKIFIDWVLFSKPISSEPKSPEERINVFKDLYTQSKRKPIEENYKDRYKKAKIDSTQSK